MTKKHFKSFSDKITYSSYTVNMSICARHAYRYIVTYLVSLRLFALGHSFYERSHFKNIWHHLVNDIIEVALLGEVERGVKGHVRGQCQLNFEQGINVECWVRVLNQVLQGTSHSAAEPSKNVSVHMFCVGLPSLWVQISTKQLSVLLNETERKKSCENLL